MAKCLHTQEDEVEGPDPLDRRVGDDRLLDERADAERHRHDLERLSGRVADDRQQGARSAGRQRSADGEEDARSRNDDQDERGERECR